MAKRRGRYKIRRKVDNLKQTIRNEIIGIIIIGMVCLGLVVIFTEQNGVLGARIKGSLLMICGGGHVWLLLMIGAWGISFMNRKRSGLGRRGVGLFLLWLIFLGLLQLQLPGIETFSQEEMLSSGKSGYGGGIIGAGLILLLRTSVGLNGSYVILVMGALIGALLVLNRSLISGLHDICEASKQITGWMKEQIYDFISVFKSQPEVLSSIEDNTSMASVKKEKKKVKINKGSQHGDQSFSDKPLVIRTLGETLESEEFIDVPVKYEPVLEMVSEEDIGNAVLNINQKLTGTPISRQVRDTDNYQLPPLLLLQKSMKVNNQRLNKDLADNVKKLEDTLASFGVNVKVTHVTQGPVLTRYEAQPASGVKVSKITNLSDDIALALAATHVRIEAPVPGKSVVGIEVPNKVVNAVQFREVIETPEFQNSSSKITMALGKDITGSTVIADLTKMPHMLIAGATGSGKSVCINTIIHSILFKARPDEVKLLLIDPKMVELANYNGIPHLIAPVVTDPKKAAGALKWIVTEMETRYELFAAAGVRDIVRYNYLRTQDKQNNLAILPYVVVIIDELSDLMMVSPGEVEDAICRIAQMARAAGIHLIVATQRPSVDVITGLIKANIPSRIAFAVSSQTDSRTILDLNGAEKLLGRGDMLYYPMGAGKPLRIQGCFLADKEMENVIKFLQNQAKPEYQELPNIEFASANKVEEEMDDLFYQAAQLFIENSNASVSLLQRRLRIGYTRAARLMDLLEEKGVVGGYEGSKPREVLLSRGQFELKYGWKEITSK
ncbi:MAG: DNA translocase FtsK [Desulfitobacteriaceae bacterium]|nr:DNA translocase FtsK [Desulfitobacteriaceae bacterium]MDD4345689.1 DNA translocase FtsK [Desulfitobacteriaceae bacterium]MDD4401907.1 DNA translocase FtsK [Desulfitobacteriaceae bacterium]